MTVFGLGTEGVKRKPRRKEEADLQCSLVEFLQVALPREAICFSIPNGGSRDIREAANLKRQGLLAGCPDLCLIYLGKAFGLELKARKGMLSDSQRVTFPRLQAAGMRVEVARSFGEAVSIIKEFGIPLKVANDKYDARDVFRDATRRRA